MVEYYIPQSVMRWTAKCGEARVFVDPDILFFHTSLEKSGIAVACRMVVVGAAMPYAGLVDRFGIAGRGQPHSVKPATHSIDGCIDLG